LFCCISHKGRGWLLGFLAVGLFLVFWPWSAVLQPVLSWVLGLAFVAFTLWASADICSGIYVKAHCSNSRQTGAVALTFDDGPCAQSEEVLDLLKDYGAKATFFVVGSRMEGQHKLLLRLLAEGHQLGNHTWAHRSWFPLLRPAQMRKEIMQTQTEIERVSGRTCRFFRPPFGVTNPLLAKALKGSGMDVAGWSVRSFDTRGEAPEVVFKRITRRLKGGDVVLLHDTSVPVVPVLKLLLPWLAQHNLQSLTLDAFWAEGPKKQPI